jgi:para-nitrobenzyl esterase
VIEAERRAIQPKASEHTWVYQLDWQAPVDGGKWKAHHGLDVPLVFDSCARVPEMVGTGSDAHRVADQMSEALLAFAGSGNPNTKAIPTWPVYDLTHRSTMVFDVDAKVVNDPRGDERRMFEKVPYVQPGT